MRYFKRLLFSLSLILVILSPTTAFSSDMIQIKGSDTMVNLVQAWAEAYMEKHPEAFIAVTGGGSGTGIASIIGGTCDFAMSSRAVTQKERDLAAKKGSDPKEHVVGLDGLAVIVHKDNPVHQLTIDQLEGVFTGRIKNWKELGGPDLKIVVLSREVNSGTHVYFKEHVIRKGDPKAPGEFSPEALLLSSSQAIADEVAQNLGAVGYYGMGYITPAHRAVSVAKDASSEYIYPDIEHVVNGSYPIARPLFIYTRGEPQGEAKSFLDFMLSPEGQKIVQETDFVPIKK